jgi:hypothetical protein
MKVWKKMKYPNLPKILKNEILAYFHERDFDFIWKFQKENLKKEIHASVKLVKTIKWENFFYLVIPEWIEKNQLNSHFSN